MNKSISPQRLILPAALIVIILTACAAAPPQVAYYSLLGDAGQRTAGPRLEGLVLSVGPVHVPDVLKRSQIATGGGEERYRLSDYHRWAGEVDREFARALAEQLAGKLGTEQVYLFPGDQYLNPNWQVSIDVLEMNGALAKEARLTVRWTLIDPKGKTAPLTRQTRLRTQPDGDGHDAWVGAQQDNISQLSEEIGALIRQRSRP